MQCRHVAVYDEEDRFAGWPANHGIWTFGNEIVVGFNLGWLDKNTDPDRVIDFHKVDYQKPSYLRQSRSLDGGQTWALEEVPELSAYRTTDIRPFYGNLNFTDPEMSIRFHPRGLDAGAISPFFYSTDRCKTWIGPFETPAMGLTGITARSELLPLSESEALLFFACPKSDGNEGRAAVAKISEGGRRFEFLSYIGDEPPGFTIMPAAYRRDNGEILVILRESDPSGSRLTQFISKDVGKTWEFDQYVDEFKLSTPPALAASTDGRLCLSYGWRDKPEGLAVKYSDDEGRTWSERINLRTDGGNHDLGYTRLTALPDGSMFTAYYYNTDPDGARTISGTIFKI